MIVDLPFGSSFHGKGRPLRMGFFHISNNNLSVRRQCARDVGMYDLNASKSEDVDLCFRVALSPRWVAWREEEAVVRHKGRRTLWGLITQMWGWGYYVGYPYAKTGIRGVYLYRWNGRRHYVRRSETEPFPILVCLFATDFHLTNLCAVALALAAVMRLPIMALAAFLGFAWSLRGYLYEVRRAGFRPWDTFKLAVVHYLTDVAFTVATFLGALRHRVILVPSSIFVPDLPKLTSPDNSLLKPSVR